MNKPIVICGSVLAAYFLVAIWIMAHDDYHGINDLYMSILAALAGLAGVGLAIYGWEKKC
jgi:hypothetical protein